MTRAQRVIGMLLGVVLLSGASACAPSKSDSQPRPASPASTEVTEAPTGRAAMLAHASEVWPQIQAGLTSDQNWDPPASSSQASAAAIGTVTPEWDYSAARLSTEGASPWLGLDQPYAGHVYLVAIVSGGVPVGTAKTWDMDGRWTIFPVRNYYAMEAKARPLIDAHFGGGPYETAFVEAGGVWLLARSGSEVVGVMLEPFGESHRESTPSGLITGTKLNWWLSHPLGAR